MATNADVLAMAKVHITSWQETYPGILPIAMLERLSIADEAIRWQRMLDHRRREPFDTLFVAEKETAIVGYGACGEQRTKLLREHGFTGEVGELYVLKCAQRQGAGSALLYAMAAALFRQGHRAMSLWVLRENEVARNFYQQLGGVPVMEKRGGLPKVAYGWADLRQLKAAPR